MMLDKGFDINWDQAHNVRIRAAGLSKTQLKEKIRYAATKQTLFGNLMWVSPPIVETSP